SYFAVDHPSGLFAVAPAAALRDLLAQVEERRFLPGREPHGANGVGHAELGHHAACDFTRPLEVVGRARGDLAEAEFLGRTAAEEHGQSVFQLLAAEDVAVVGRRLLRVAEGADAT